MIKKSKNQLNINKIFKNIDEISVETQKKIEKSIKYW